MLRSTVCGSSICFVRDLGQLASVCDIALYCGSGKSDLARIGSTVYRCAEQAFVLQKRFSYIPRCSNKLLYLLLKESGDAAGFGAILDKLRDGLVTS